MWRTSPGDIRRRLAHDMKRQEKDDKITVNTYQNKLSSQSYRRLNMPTMAGRPTLSRPSKSVRLLELEATSNASSRQASQRQVGGKRWTRLGWAGCGCGREDAQQGNSGHPGLFFCLRCFGVGKARVDCKGCLAGSAALAKRRLRVLCCAA